VFLVAFGLVGIALVQWLYFVAIDRLPIGIGLLFEFSAPVLIALWALLVVQVAVLRPRLDRRAHQLIHGLAPPRSHLHLAYIAAECAKVLLLPAFGILLALRLMP